MVNCYLFPKSLTVYSYPPKTRIYPAPPENNAKMGAPSSFSWVFRGNGLKIAWRPIWICKVTMNINDTVPISISARNGYRPIPEIHCNCLLLGLDHQGMVHEK